MSQPRIEGYRGPRPCETCGVSFTPKNVTPRPGRGRFCSRPCASRQPLYTLDEAFWAHVQKTDGCWLWTGATAPSGYGYLSFNGKRSSAHRFAFKLLRGKIGQGLFVCHTCDVRSCVNPDHFFLGTAKDNMSDASRKGRMPHGERAASSKLTEADVVEIRRRYAAGGVRQSDLANEFGVTQCVVGDVIRRVGWKHVALQKGQHPWQTA